MAVTIKATVIQEDKGNLHLGLDSEDGMTYQTVTNTWLISQIKQACQGLSGQPSEISISIDSVQ